MDDKGRGLLRVDRSLSLRYVDWTGAMCEEGESMSIGCKKEGELEVDVDIW